MDSTMMPRVLLIVFMCVKAYADFTVQPMSQTVTEGEQATFRCQYPGATFLLWTLNNVSLNQHPPQNVYEQVVCDPAGIELELLIISAHVVVEFNGTMVVCEARFSDGSPPEVSSPAVLRVNIATSNTTAVSNGFDIEPMSNTVAKDKEALFHCQNSITERIHWEINGTALNLVHSEAVIVHTDRSNIGGTLHTLSIRGNLHYNLTIIVCVASVISEVFRTEPAILLVVDGNIGPVTDVAAVNGSRIILQWSSPFTLDLTGITPDVVYCVDVYNVSDSGDGNTDNRVLSTCNVMEPEYIFTHDYANPAHDFKFVITPRLNVENAINGTQSEPVFASFDDHCKPTVYSSPMTDQFVPVNSKENVTYRCSVESGNTVVWVINGTQVHSDDQFDTFMSLGYFIEPRNRISNVSTISVTEVARSRVNHTDLNVQCLSTVGIETCPGQVYRVGTFAAPSGVEDLVLLPSLTLEWNRPSLPPFPQFQVPINYTIEINATPENEKLMILREFTSYTSFSISFLQEYILRELGRECVQFEFSVSATNEAGTGPLRRVQDTIPISPDVRNISRDLTVISVNLQPLTVQILLPPVIPCSDIFSLTNYTINIDGAMHHTLTPGEVTLGVPLSISGFTQDASFSLTVTACNEINCRTSNSTTLNTTDVQAVQAVFFQKNLFLQCSFAHNSLARGSVFKFTIITTNEINRYEVSRQEGSMCTHTSNQLDTYGSMLVMDWEESGEDGNVALDITNIVMNVSTPEEYTALTGCPVTEPEATCNFNPILSATLSVGGVLFIMIIILFTCLLCIYFKRRTSTTVKEPELPTVITQRQPDPDLQSEVRRLNIANQRMEEELRELKAQLKSKIVEKPVLSTLKRKNKFAAFASAEEQPLMFECDITADEECARKIKNDLITAQHQTSFTSDSAPATSKGRYSMIPMADVERDKHVVIEDHDDPDPEKPLTIKVKWRPLIQSLIAVKSRRPDAKPLLAEGKDLSKVKVRLDMS